MIQVTVPLWDADKNRVVMTIMRGNYSFVYDTTAGISAVIEEVTPDGSVFYIREPGGELLARVNGSDIRYYHFDELGSTRMLTDASGTVTDRYVFNAWGNALSHTGATDQPYQYVGRLGYYTHTQDPEFALMQLGVRFYDPEVGMFGQRDIVVNPMRTAYVYVENSPTFYIDATGLFPQTTGSTRTSQGKQKDRYKEKAKRCKKQLENCIKCATAAIGGVMAVCHLNCQGIGEPKAKAACEAGCASVGKTALAAATVACSLTYINCMTYEPDISGCKNPYAWCPTPR